MRPASLACIALLLLLAPSAMADEADTPAVLRIGDAAPDIDIAHWIKGVEMDRRGAFEPTTTFGDGRIYVLEFWATWCGPCRAGMPHLSELQEAYGERGVTIIGISDETLPKVVAFLFQEDKRDGLLNDERTRYILATDPDGSVKNDYFRAAGRTGIPSAIVVGKDGHIEWIGHPARMDDVLEALVTDAWDRAAFAVEYAEQQAYERMMREARGRMTAAQRAGDWEAYVAVLDELLVQKPGDKRLLQTKFQTLLTKVQVETTEDVDVAYAVGDELLKAAWDDAQTLNAVAWMIVDDDAVSAADHGFALRAAERARDLTEEQDAAILDTLARVHYESGDLERALLWQRKAVEEAAEGAMAEGLRKVLDEYEAEAASKAE